MKVLICGNGQMAKGFASFLKKEKISYEKFTKNTEGKFDFAVHLGSGRELKDLIKFCEENKIPLIQASTGQKIKSKPETFILDLPNVSLEILRSLIFLQEIKIFAQQNKMKIELTESHQSSKKTTPGTAILIAKILGIPKNKIISKRNIKKAHAHHFIKLSKKEIEIEYSIKINGRETYFEGLLSIIKILKKEKLRKGFYDINYLIKKI